MMFFETLFSYILMQWIKNKTPPGFFAPSIVVEDAF